MQCRYCGVRNPATAAVCRACGRRLATKGPSNETAGPGISRAVHRDDPALSHLRFGSRFRTEQYWRTRHLSGFTSSTHPSAPAPGDAMPGGEPAGSAALPRFDHDVDRTNASGRQSAGRPERDAGIPPAGEADPRVSQQPAALTSKQAILRFFCMVAVFIIGITVGLYAARSMKRPPAAMPAAVSQSSPAPAAAVAARNPDRHRRPAAIRGISPSELPYDGAPPPTDEAAASDTTMVEKYSGASVPEPDTTPMHSAPPSEVPVSEKERDVPAEKKSVNEEKKARAAEASTPPAIARNVEKPKSGGGDAVRAKKREKARAAKEREIERIKRQADHELQRKLDTSAAEGAEAKRRLASSRRNDGRVAASVPDTQKARVQKILGKCERASNLFRREQCKWQVCGNRWGKNGCPSYPKPVSSY